MSPGRQEQVAAEAAALVNVQRMKAPLVVIAWPNEHARSYLGWRRAIIASRPVTTIIHFMLLAFALGMVCGRAF